MNQELIHASTWDCPHCGVWMPGSVFRGADYDALAIFDRDTTKPAPHVVCQGCGCDFIAIRTGRQPFLSLSRWNRSCKDKVDV